ncbi:hypothetical protein F5Y14DRAFT_436190 [Nemania sp. NC0429]|nr:hypothetical protein F5Y14DRAFT_436190 [Nemania sp. NC0429]
MVDTCRKQLALLFSQTYSRDVTKRSSSCKCCFFTLFTYLLPTQRIFVIVFSAIAMRPGVEALPIELVDQIADLIYREDVLSLRLTSRTLASKLSPRQLTPLFACKQIELTPESLKKLVYVTDQGRVGCLLKHFTICGVLDSDAIGRPDVDERVRLLTEAFANLKQYSPRASLASLQLVAPTLEDSLYVPLEKRQEATQRTYNIAMTALCESQLSVDRHLSLFFDDPCGGLIYKALISLSQQSVSTTTFSSLEWLSMRLSSEYVSPNQKTPRGCTEDQSVHGTSLLQALPEILVIMPKLEHLDVQWYNLEGHAMITPGASTIHPNPSSHSSCVSLQTCELSGLYTYESDLLRYLKACRPTRLLMTDTWLMSGTWRSIFDYVASSASSDSPVKLFYFDDLHEGLNLVHFHLEPGHSKFRYHGGVTMGPSTLTRVRNKGEPIHYMTTDRRALGSPERLSWVQSKRMRFGMYDSFC